MAGFTSKLTYDMRMVISVRDIADPIGEMLGDGIRTRVLVRGQELNQLEQDYELWCRS